MINRWRTWRVALLWRYFSPSSFCLELFSKLVENSCCSCVSEWVSEWTRRAKEWMVSGFLSQVLQSTSEIPPASAPSSPLFADFPLCWFPSFAISPLLLISPLFHFFTLLFLSLFLLFLLPPLFATPLTAKVYREWTKRSLFLSLSLRTTGRGQVNVWKEAKKKREKCTEDKEDRKEREGNGFANEAPEWNGCVITISWTIHTRGHCLVVFSPLLLSFLSPLLIIILGIIIILSSLSSSFFLAPSHQSQGGEKHDSRALEKEVGPDILSVQPKITSSRETRRKERCKEREKGRRNAIHSFFNLRSFPSSVFHHPLFLTSTVKVAVSRYGHRYDYLLHFSSLSLFLSLPSYSHSILSF